MIGEYICHTCGATFDPRSLIFQCPCGGLLDLKRQAIRFKPEEILTREWSLFRYHTVLPFAPGTNAWKGISMGEGLTPLVPLDPAEPNLLVKMDFMMPTLSFKDRGAVVLIAKAKELGVTRVVQDSSGNAGTAVAAYAARAGMACDIFVPESTSPKKINQIAAHGATVHPIPGSREDTAAAALEAAQKGDAFYASHVYNPFFYEGTKTYAYEVFEQLGSLPDTFVVPVGNGTLLLGVYYACKELLHAGLIEKVPAILAVQAEGCAPLHEAFHRGEKTVSPMEPRETQAEGIAIAEPKRAGQILEAVRATGGTLVTAPEEAIAETRQALAQKGFYVEPTTAATVAGYTAHVRKVGATQFGKVVIPLCGAGLKAG